MKKEEDFVMGLSIYMACLREKKRYSTAKSYQDALNSFKCFCGMEAIPYAYINRNRLLCYQSWLLDKGRSLNTVSTYMRRIRHIYNLAVEANEAPFVPSLFKDVFTGVESKRKKALPREMLERMFNAPLGGSVLAACTVDRSVDVRVQRDSVCGSHAFEMGEYPGWDIAVSPTKERVSHTAGDSLRGVAAVG